jgi:hypothetical protein
MTITISELSKYRKYKKFRTGILAAFIVICTSQELYIHYYLSIETGYTHFYYIFIAIVAILYHLKSVFFGGYLAALHLGIEWVISGGMIDPSTVLRSLMFVFLAVLLGFVFMRIERDHGDMVAYLIDRTLRESNPLQMKDAEVGEIASQTFAGTTIHLLKQKKNIKGLIAALNHPDTEARYRAAIALGELGDPEAVGALSLALKDENSGVRWEAAEALGKIGEPALDVLIDALKGDDDDIRWRAAIALGDIGNEYAVAPLIGTLSDPDPYVRSRTVRSLSRIGEPAIDPLMDVFKEGSETVRECTGAALAGMKPETIPAIKRALDRLSDGEKEELHKAIEKYK